MLRSFYARHVALSLRRASRPYNLPNRQYARPKSTLRPTTGPAKQQVGQQPPPSSPFARTRALPWVLLSITAGGIGLYISLLIVSARQPCTNPTISDVAQQQDVSKRYDETADNFDSEVGVSEVLMGINRVRKRLAQQCVGHVLEVSCGTGRNLGYYDVGAESAIESLTFVDLSPPMIEVCKKKWNVLYGSTMSTPSTLREQPFKPGLVVRFLTSSALEPMPPAPDGRAYDTIIQTMGLCSTPAPQALLSNMIRHLNIANPEARILLLEHGRSYRAWLNNILDGAAQKHAEIHGCWFNRDIGAVVEEAAKRAGLQVVSEKRHHVGTTWVYELRPHPELVKRAQAAEKNRGANVPAEQQAAAAPKESWRSWLGLG